MKHKFCERNAKSITTKGMFDWLITCSIGKPISFLSTTFLLENFSDRSGKIYLCSHWYLKASIEYTFCASPFFKLQDCNINILYYDRFSTTQPFFQEHWSNHRHVSKRPIKISFLYNLKKEKNTTQTRRLPVL